MIESITYEFRTGTENDRNFSYLFVWNRRTAGI